VRSASVEIFNPVAPIDAYRPIGPLTLTVPFVGKLPASRFTHSTRSTPATTLINSLPYFRTATKGSMYNGIVKKQVSDVPRLKPGRFCLMGRQSRSKGRAWDRNRTYMGRQSDAKMLR
jgi:hypothetical protein